MDEVNIINLIKNTVKSDYIGDDCAYLKQFGIVITQDSLVENIHFIRDWYTPYQLGYKAVSVNISDVIASGAEPKYITISLSIPNCINEDYITEFYKGAKAALNGAEIVGGDITGSKNSIFISISAIGSDKGRNISSRSNAKPGYIVITKGEHGSSSAGLSELMNKGTNYELINAHLVPILEHDFSKNISLSVQEPYAMMDTSDGLADALFKIAEASNAKIIIDYNKIPHRIDVLKEQVLFGGEDYKLIAAVPNKYLNNINNACIIGYVDNYDGIRLDISGQQYKKYSELKVYNHFGDNNG